MVLANKRLAEAVRKEAQQAAAADEALTRYLSSFPEYRDTMDRLAKQGLDPMAWFNVASARFAFSVDSTKPSEALLAEVFQQCDLDPKKPRHWRILVDSLVDQLFRSAGAPQKWTDERLFVLLCDIRELQKLYPAVKENGQLAKLLLSKKPYKEKYHNDFNQETLRKLVGKALNPKLNPTAAIADDDDFIAARAEQAARKLGLPTELGNMALTEMLEKDLLAQWRAHFEEKYRAEGRTFTEANWQAFLPALHLIVDAQVKSLRGGDAD